MLPIRILAILFGMSILISCEKESSFPSEIVESELSQQIDNLIIDLILSEAKVFDWNEQSDDFLCKALPLTDNIFVAGFGLNENGKQNLDKYLNAHQGSITIEDRNNKLGFYFLKTEYCYHISAIRHIDGVEFVELDYYPSDISKLIGDEPIEIPDISFRSTVSGNPGLFEPGSGSYLDYLSNFDESKAERADNHNMGPVFDELGYFGSASTGVGVIDNGIQADEVDYHIVGPGGFTMEGHFQTNWWNPNLPADGPHPRPNDFLGIWQHITPSYNHGTSMVNNIYAMSPFSYRRSLRGSPTYIVLLPSQFKAIAQSIVDLADDPQIKIVSVSMGSPFGNHQMKTAIRYLNSKNKMMVAASGSTLPILRDILGILFPARIPETVATTGIQDLYDTNGEFILGWQCHGGLANDFVLEHSESSSSTASMLAGMFATIWDINPSLEREDLIQLMIENSYYYNERGHKHPKLGWGKIDMYDLALDVEETL